MLPTDMPWCSYRTKLILQTANVVHRHFVVGHLGVFVLCIQANYVFESCCGFQLLLGLFGVFVLFGLFLFLGCLFLCKSGLFLLPRLTAATVPSGWPGDSFLYFVLAFATAALCCTELVFMALWTASTCFSMFSRFPSPRLCHAMAVLTCVMSIDLNNLPKIFLQHDSEGFFLCSQNRSTSLLAKAEGVAVKTNLTPVAKSSSSYGPHSSMILSFAVL